jgi:hypothetical protein
VYLGYARFRLVLNKMSRPVRQSRFKSPETDLFILRQTFLCKIASVSQAAQPSISLHRYTSKCLGLAYLYLPDLRISSRLANFDTTYGIRAPFPPTSGPKVALRGRPSRIRAIPTFSLAQFLPLDSRSYTALRIPLRLEIPKGTKDLFNLRRRKARIMYLLWLERL